MPSSYSLITSASYANAANAVVNETQFTQISANDASFNDGAGIADGVIVGRHLFNAFSQCDEWEARAGGLFPPSWALISGASTTSVTIANRNPQRLGAATLLQRNNMVRIAGGELIRAKFQISVNFAGVPTAKTMGLYKAATGIWIYMGFTSGVANQIACVATTDAGVVTTNQVSFTYVSDTIYDFMIEADTTSTRFYIDGTLINTIAAASSSSTTNLIPYMFENGFQNFQIHKSWFNLE